MKYILAIILFCSSLVPGLSQFLNGKPSANDMYTIELVEIYKKRAIYSLNLSQISDNDRANFIDNLYRSSNIVVISRMDSSFNLKISTQISVSIDTIKEEINQIISSISSSMETAPTKF